MIPVNVSDSISVAHYASIHLLSHSPLVLWVELFMPTVLEWRAIVRAGSLAFNEFSSIT
jgi:hypothetical protein